MGNSFTTNTNQSKSLEEIHRAPLALAESSPVPSPVEQAPLANAFPEASPTAEHGQTSETLGDLSASAAETSQRSSRPEPGLEVIDLASAAAESMSPEDPLSNTEERASAITDHAPEIIDHASEVLQDPSVSIDILLREAGLLDQLVIDKQDKPGRTAFNRFLKFLDYSGIKSCSSVDDIPGAMISLSPGVFTTYPTFLERAKASPSTVILPSYHYHLLFLILTPLPCRFIMSSARSSTATTGFGVDSTLGTQTLFAYFQ